MKNWDVPDLQHIYLIYLFNIYTYIYWNNQYFNKLQIYKDLKFRKN